VNRTETVLSTDDLRVGFTHSFRVADHPGVDAFAQRYRVYHDKSNFEQLQTVLWTAIGCGHFEQMRAHVILKLNCADNELEATLAALAATRARIF
jgi:hypothetical protein